MTEGSPNFPQHHKSKRWLLPVSSIPILPIFALFSAGGTRSNPNNQSTGFLVHRTHQGLFLQYSPTLQVPQLRDGSIKSRNRSPGTQRLFRISRPAHFCTGRRTDSGAFERLWTERLWRTLSMSALWTTDQGPSKNYRRTMVWSVGNIHFEAVHNSELWPQIMLFMGTYPLSVCRGGTSHYIEESML